MHQVRIGIHLMSFLRLPLLELSERRRNVSRRRMWGAGGHILAEKLCTIILGEYEPAAKLLPPAFESAGPVSVLKSDRLVSGPLVARSRAHTTHT